MEGWTEKVRRILDGTPTRALPLSRVMSALTEAKALDGCGAGLFLQRILDQPETFTVIPDRVGPWMRGSLPCTSHSTRPGTGTGTGTGQPDPWILTHTPGAAPFGAEERALSCVGESLQAWGREIDDGSQVAVARWIGATGEVEKMFRKLFTREAGHLEKPRSTSRLLCPLPGGSNPQPGRLPEFPRVAPPGCR